MKRSKRSTNDQIITKQSKIDPKNSATELEDFPRFSKGTVSISLSELPHHQYRLHKAVLERNSSWFTKELSKASIIDNTATSSNDGIKHEFDLRQLPESVIPELALKVSPWTPL